MTIRLKLILSFLFLIVLTVVLYGSATYSSMTGPLRSLQENAALHLGQLFTYQIDAIVENAKEELSILSEKDFIAHFQDPSGVPHYAKDRPLEPTHHEYVEKALFIPQGHPAPDSLAGLPATSLAPPGNDLETSILPLQEPDSPLFRISKKFYDTQGTFQGVGFIFLSLERMFNKIFLDRSFKETCICIRDKSGRALYSNEEEPVEEQRMDLIRSYSAQVSDNPPLDKGHPFHTTAIFDNEENLLLIGSTLPDLGLFVFIEPNFLSPKSIIASMSMNMLLIGLGIVWITVWTAMILGHRIMKPIENLSLGAEKIASGEYEYRLKTQGKDEIGLLARKFNEMAEAVEARSKDLETSNQALKKQDQKKTRFLDTVAHDLRTPLTSIKAYAELLLRFPGEEQKTKEEFMNIIVQESIRMSSLINDYLDLTKLEGGTLLYTFREVNIEAMIQQYIGVNRVAGKLRQITITEQMDAPLPKVWADPNRLGQVFANLFDNALKFSSPGGEITLDARAVKDPMEPGGTDWIQVSISDQGPGVPKEFHEMIFEKFNQLDRSNLPSKGGTGLGLPISREIIQKHSGKIWVENSTPKGTIFKFRLPIKAS